jgi:hypothetical protein
MGNFDDGDKDNGVTSTLNALSREWEQKHGVIIDDLGTSSIPQYCPHRAKWLIPQPKFGGLRA